jgi:hypothetical protein
LEATPLQENNMNQELASAIGVAAVATLAATTVVFTPTDALADDITMDTTKFVSTASRDDVRAIVKAEPALVLQAASEWALQDNQATRVKSNYTGAQARAAYIIERREVAALNAEDSGSNSPWLLKTRPADTATMGGPSR